MRILLLLAFVLGGCAELQLTADPVDGILADVVNAVRAPVGEQKAALARAQQAHAKEAAAPNRLRLGLMLAMLPAPLRDDARAAELLEPLADAASPGIGRLAALLYPQIVERQRVARDLERLARERERERGERAASDRDRDKREESLRQQLEALRSIERGILEREERLRRQKVRP